MIIPSQNEADISDIPDAVKNELKFIIADNIETVLENALCEKPKPNEYKYVDSSCVDSKEAMIKQ